MAWVKNMCPYGGQELLIQCNLLPIADPASQPVTAAAVIEHITFVTQFAELCVVWIQPGFLYKSLKLVWRRIRFTET